MKPAGRSPASPLATVLAAGLAAVLSASAARAGDTVKKTEDLLGSVADIGSKLEMADVPSPIEIASDRLEFDYEKGVLRYQGNVTVDHAGAKIHANSLEVSFEPEGKRSLKKITASGDVEVIRGKETATGDLAEYEPATGTIVLSNNARLGSGPNSVAGEKVVVYLEEGRAVVQGRAGDTAGGTTTPSDGTTPAPTGSGRVRVVLMPESLEKKGEAKP